MTSSTPRATGHIVDEDVTGIPSFEAAGGDWSEIAEEAARLGEERIVVNMGPQHPSTHGVLRLMLEIDGETVTEARAGVGYLHTGIEKNMEFRTWTQGVTFCVRAQFWMIQAALPKMLAKFGGDAGRIGAGLDGRSSGR